MTKTFDIYYDAHNPVARDLYWKQTSYSLVKRYGWDACWVDQCEPDNGKLSDERKKANFLLEKELIILILIPEVKLFAKNTSNKMGIIYFLANTFFK